MEAGQAHPRGDFELMSVNARHVKQVPGRRTDLTDAAWLCQLVEAGLLKANLVPPKPIRELRQLTRYRKTQIAERQREANRLHNALADTNIKLDRLATDILAVSGRAMLDALRSGTTDPEILAELAKGRLRAKLPQLREALEGRFDELHALPIGAILAHLDFLDEQIDRLSDAIEQRLATFGPAVELLCTIPGVGRYTRRGAAHRRGHPRRDPPRHERVPVRPPPGLLGGAMPGQRPLRRQAALRQDPQGQQMAQPRPRRPRWPAIANRARQGNRRRQTLDHLRLLAHAHHRRALPQGRRQLSPNATPNAPPDASSPSSSGSHTCTLEHAAA